MFACGGILELDNHKNCDRIQWLNALTERSLICGHEREGTVGALGSADRRATPERAARAARLIPVTGWIEMSLPG